MAANEHRHRIDRERFLAEMEQRGWRLDPNGWIVPEGRRVQQRESDWLAAILLAIQCECPHDKESAGDIPKQA